MRIPPANRDGTPPRLLVVGDIMLDLFVQGDSSTLSPEAPVPVIAEQEEKAAAGGAANVAMNLAALGAEVTLIGVVGQDDEGVRLRKVVEAGGVATSSLVEVSDRPTTRKMRLVTRRQQVARLDREDLSGLSEATVAALLEKLEQAMDGQQALVVPDYGKNVVCSRVWSVLIESGRERDIPVLVDPSPRRKIEHYSDAGLIKVNWPEALLAASLTGTEADALERAGAAVMEKTGAGCVVVTRGDRGLSVFRPQQERFDIAARRVEVFDVTGAGDTVISVLAWGMVYGLPLEEAARLANLAGGLAVQKLGTVSVSRQDLERALIPEAGLRDKLVPRRELAVRLDERRRAGHSIVFTNGCFDLFHVGHVRLLKHCATCGDVVVVGLNSDRSVRAVKGPERPLLHEDDRALLLAALPEVQMVVLFDEETPREILSEVRPDVLVKGGDYRPEDVVGRRQVEAAGGRLELVPLRDGASTTEILRRIRGERRGPEKEEEGEHGSEQP